MLFKHVPDDSHRFLLMVVVQYSVVLRQRWLALMASTKSTGIPAIVLTRQSACCYAPATSARACMR